LPFLRPFIEPGLELKLCMTVAAPRLQFVDHFAS